MKNKVLVGLVVVLLVINVAMLIIIWNGRPQDDRDLPNRPGRRVERLLDRKLNLTEQQKEEIALLHEEHLANNAPLHRQIERSRKRLAEADDHDVNKLMDRLASLHRQVEWNNYLHMTAIKEQLTPAQAIQFDSLMHRVIERVGDRKKRHRRNGKR